MAGAEIVDLDLDADGVQVIEQAGGRCDVLHDGAFGDFEGQQRWRQAAFVQCAEDAFTQAALRIWTGEILTETGRAARPFRFQAAAWQQAVASTQSPIGVIEATLFGEIDEDWWRQRPMVGCCQRSSASTPIRCPLSPSTCAW